MKKVKFFIVMSMIITSSVLVFSSCGNDLLMDTDKCAEVALEYLENKYQTEFEVVSSGEKGGMFGKLGFAEVIVSNKSENTDNKYTVVVYPDGSEDKDDDSRYDSYKVISDTYMSELIRKYAKEKIDSLLMEAGLTRFISRISIDEISKTKGFSGFTADFTLVNEKDFSLEQLLVNYCIDINCSLEVPENEFNYKLQDNITSQFKTLISDDSIGFNVEVYSEEIYIEREELYKENESLFRNDRINRLRGIARISFYVEEEDEDESK